VISLFSNFVNSAHGKAISAFALVVAVVSMAGAAHADAISDAFTASQTSLTTYITAGVGVIVAIVGLGLGVTVLVKYLRKAARAA
jgi:hypothetical protein